MRSYATGTENESSMVDVIVQQLDAAEYDPNDPESATISLVALRNEIGKLNEKLAVARFRIGVIISQNVLGLTATEYANTFQLKEYEISQCRRMAEKFGGDESAFLSALKSVGGTWYKAEKALLRRSNTSRQPLQRLVNKVVPIIEDVRIDPNSVTEREHLNYIRETIDNLLPPSLSRYDGSFLKYNACSSCGHYPPPLEGFELAELPGVRHVQFPLCPTCVRKGLTPETERVNQLLVSYISNLINDVVYK